MLGVLTRHNVPQKKKKKIEFYQNTVLPQIFTLTMKIWNKNWK